MEKSYLLPLSALHNADPGTPDQVFGPDGDFPDAPHFTGPVLGRVRGETPIAYHHVCTSYEPDKIGVMRNDGAWKLCDAPALDLRIPSVAARLAGLCARALGQASDRGWGIGPANPEWCLQSQWGTRAFNWSLKGVPYGDLLSLPRKMLTPEDVLAALTLALADKIAALGGDR